jgi:hypothetical protein
MTPEILSKLLDYIDAKITETEARTSSDGGLLESLHARQLREELESLVQDEQ